MKRVLEGLEPNRLFYYFEEISRIPRESGNEEAISQYMENFATQLGLWVKRDEVNNVYIRKPASEGYEHLPTIILQGHLDMVCEKNKDVVHDFKTDGIQLVVEDDFIKAKGTTLGADNGVAIAYQMAILADTTLKHPPLEVLMTTSEETGMFGVAGMHPEYLKGKILLNLDTDIEGEFLVSCAGGIRAYTRLPIQREEVEGMNCFMIRVENLLGGHSGADIHLERGNATLLLGRVLNSIQEEKGLRLCSIEGGGKDNVIPREAQATIATFASSQEISRIIGEIEEYLKVEYKMQDPNLSVVLEETTKAMQTPLDEMSTNKVLNTLILMPNGVVGYSKHIENLVETSLNLGVMQTSEDHVKMVSAIRSSVPTKKEEVVQKLKALANVMGATFEVQGDYPAWVYKEDSSIRQTAVAVYEELYNQKPEIKAIHAGLECGFIAEKIEGIDIIAFGPNAYDIHSPLERVSISSMKRVYAYLVHLLEKIKQYS
jgi:dipeptidase D